MTARRARPEARPRRPKGDRRQLTLKETTTMRKLAIAALAASPVLAVLVTHVPVLADVIWH